MNWQLFTKLFTKKRAARPARGRPEPEQARMNWRLFTKLFTKKRAARPARGRPEPPAPQPEIRLGNGLILLIILVGILILIINFFPSNVLRIILSVPFLLFFPGYAISAALFTRKEEISHTERVVLSCILSVVVVALIGLILNYTRWGIRMELILYSVAILVLLISIIAWLRQLRLKEKERFSIRLKLTWLGSVKHIKNRALTITLVLAILGALGTLVYLVATPEEGEAFTEFYILGQQGKLEDYPDELKVGDEVSVIVGIINHQGVEVNYSVEVVIGGKKTAAVGPVVLADKQSWEGEVSFVADVPGENQKIEFVLYKDGEVEPDKGPLHLWFDVTK